MGLLFFVGRKVGIPEWRLFVSSRLPTPSWDYDLQNIQVSFR